MDTWTEMAFLTGSAPGVSGKNQKVSANGSPVRVMATTPSP
jgi:hypothetical protein